VYECIYIVAVRITYLLNLLIAWNKVLLEKLTGSQLVKKFPIFYGMWKFITAFTRVRHLSLSWTSSIQSMPPHPTYWRFILILSSHLRLGLPSGLFPSDFPTKALYIQITTTLKCPNSSVVENKLLPGNAGLKQA